MGPKRSQVVTCWKVLVFGSESRNSLDVASGPQKGLLFRVRTLGHLQNPFRIAVHRARLTEESSHFWQSQRPYGQPPTPYQGRRCLHVFAPLDPHAFGCRETMVKQTLDAADSTLSARPSLAQAAKASRLNVLEAKVKHMDQ